MPAAVRTRLELSRLGAQTLPQYSMDAAQQLLETLVRSVDRPSRKVHGLQSPETEWGFSFVNGGGNQYITGAAFLGLGSDPMRSDRSFDQSINRSIRRAKCALYLFVPVDTRLNPGVKPNIAPSGIECGCQGSGDGFFPPGHNSEKRNPWRTQPVITFSNT